MGDDRHDQIGGPMASPVLSGRARAALQQHQRRVEVLQRELHGVDRVLSGALTACDGASQNEMLGAYLEAVQELRVSLQRLEGFLMQRLLRHGAEPASDSASIDVRPLDFGSSAEGAAAE
jgi:hypothetical protein